MRKICLKFDVSEMEAQTERVVELAFSKFPKGIPETLIGELLEVRNDLLLGDFVSALNADGSIEVLCPVRFGTSIENLAATIGALKRDGLGHVL